MSITPGKWKAECVGVGGSHDNPTDVYEVNTDHARIAEYLTEADARAIAEIPNMIDLLRKLEQKALHMHYASEDAGAILKRIED